MNFSKQLFPFFFRFFLSGPLNKRYRTADSFGMKVIFLLMIFAMWIDEFRLNENSAFFPTDETDLWFPEIHIPSLASLGFSSESFSKACFSVGTTSVIRNFLHRLKMRQFRNSCRSANWRALSDISFQDFLVLLQVAFDFVLHYLPIIFDLLLR